MKNNFCMVILLFSLFFGCKKEIPKESETKIPPKDYLSREWALNYKSSLDTEENSKNKAEASRKSKLLLEEGIALHKANKSAYAISKIEAAIDMYPTGNIYYHYGNSLSNINRLQDSVKAYGIALNMEIDRPELARYNLACAYSRLGQIDNAYQFLAYAIDDGYNAFAHMEKDPDLKNVRDQPDWKEKINALRQNQNNAEEELNGKITASEPRSATHYFLCKNHTLVIVDNHYCGIEGFKRGTWKSENGKLEFQLTEACLTEFVATPEEKRKHEDDLAHGRVGGNICEPGKPVFNGYCSSPNSYKPTGINKTIITQMLDKSKKDDYSEWKFTAFSSNSEPKQCNPNFVPRTLDDLVVE